MAIKTHIHIHAHTLLGSDYTLKMLTSLKKTNSVTYLCTYRDVLQKRSSDIIFYIFRIRT